MNECKRLGEGSFGRVYVSTKRDYAIKVFKKWKGYDFVNCIRECDIISRFHHPFIPKVFSIWFNSYNNLQYTMQYAQNGDLFGSKDWSEYWSLMKKGFWKRVLFNGLHVLDSFQHRQNGLLHRDIRPENILIGKNPLKDIWLGDFGNGRFMTSDRLSTEYTLKYYMAPECRSSGIYTPASDLYSLACTVIWMFLPKKMSEPWNCHEWIRFAEKFIEDENIRNFLIQFIQENPKDRITLSEAFEHPQLKSLHESFLIQKSRVRIFTCPDRKEWIKKFGQEAVKNRTKMIHSMYDFLNTYKGIRSSVLIYALQIVEDYINSFNVFSDELDEWIFVGIIACMIALCLHWTGCFPHNVRSHLNLSKRDKIFSNSRIWKTCEEILTTLQFSLTRRLIDPQYQNITLKKVKELATNDFVFF